MPKNIVFCADGTWSGPNSDDQDDVLETTNVWKLFLNIAGDPHNSRSDGRCVRLWRRAHDGGLAMQAG
ncbi:DUF2235 domain-containing protein [Caballeronia mineralivorans]|jgi:hypothetical protein|uniref:DUF2235 domain-containing protein n=1 Tax=Caballeronia mineralivorans TaxID=2010198 RepID=UPI0023EFE62B|nr:DUF2235 domain-containing protein [Caballeronia mineralivorans]MDB5789686.1 hypothetical protein [Caballeronia mineralivorans]MEA3096790.1 hypothetical protein [Caballeronia mineralivorans]